MKVGDLVKLNNASEYGWYTNWEDWGVGIVVRFEIKDNENIDNPNPIHKDYNVVVMWSRLGRLIRMCMLSSIIKVIDE